VQHLWPRRQWRQCPACNHATADSGAAAPIAASTQIAKSRRIARRQLEADKPPKGHRSMRNQTDLRLRVFQQRHALDARVDFNVDAGEFEADRLRTKANRTKF
jgi:hypothetical protein